MRIGPLSFSVLVIVVVAATGLGSARADVPPADQCTAPGQPCQNAGAVTGPGQPGTCVAATCIKTMRDADGGFTHMPYDCHRCEAPDGGTPAAGGAAGGAAGAAGGAAGAAGGAAGASSTGGTTATGGATGSGGASSTGGTAGKPVPSSSSGCAVAGVPAQPAGAAAALSFALLIIVLRRRRSRA